jgi:putative DNA primase/helicase
VFKAWNARQRVAQEREKVTSEQIRTALRKGQDATALAEQLREGEDPAPIRQRYVINDSTVEKLGELLNHNPNGLLVFRDELTGFLQTLDREGHEPDRAFYLEAWNGTGRFTYDRIARGTIDIEACCVSILGGIQPGPLGYYLQAAMKGGAGDDGLMQRFQLLVWPDVSGEWRNVDRWPDSVAKRRAYAVFIQLNEVTSTGIDAECDEDLGGIPYLRFDADAQDLFTEWRSTLEHRLRRDEDPPAIEAHLAKYRSLVPSLALLIHLADGRGHPVTLPALERACAWAQYLESHARRVYSRGLGANYVAARALAAKILKSTLPNPFALKEVYRPQWADLTTLEDAERAVRVLIDLDWLREVREETVGRPRTRYEVNPRVKDLPR